MKGKLQQSAAPDRLASLLAMQPPTSSGAVYGREGCKGQCNARQVKQQSASVHDRGTVEAAGMTKLQQEKVLLEANQTHR
jgi:hypothetical protein